MVGHRVGDTVAHKGQQWNFKRLRGSATGLYWYPELADSMSEFGLMAFCAVWQCWGSIASPIAEEKRKLFSAFESATDSVMVWRTWKDVCTYTTAVESSCRIPGP